MPLRVRESAAHNESPHGGGPSVLPLVHRRAAVGAGARRTVPPLQLDGARPIADRPYLHLPVQVRGSQGGAEDVPPVRTLPQLPVLRSSG